VLVGGCQVHGRDGVVQRAERRVAADAPDGDEDRSRRHGNRCQQPPQQRGVVVVVARTHEAAAAAAASY